MRYPNKVLEKINNKSVIEILLKRLKIKKKSIKLLLLQQINPLMTNLRMKYFGWASIVLEEVRTMF